MTLAMRVSVRPVFMSGISLARPNNLGLRMAGHIAWSWYAIYGPLIALSPSCLCTPLIVSAIRYGKLRSLLQVAKTNGRDVEEDDLS